MPTQPFSTVFRRFRDKVLIDLSKKLVTRVTEIEYIQHTKIEEFGFKGSLFTLLIRLSGVRFKRNGRISTFSFVTMNINYNLASESFNMTAVDLGDVSGDLEHDFLSKGFEEELERELLTTINSELRGVR